MNVLAIDIGGTFIKYALMDEEMRFLSRGKVPRLCQKATVWGAPTPDFVMKTLSAPGHDKAARLTAGETGEQYIKRIQREYQESNQELAASSSNLGFCVPG